MMRFVILVLFLSLNASLAGQNKKHHKDRNGNLIGYITKSAFDDPFYKGWFDYYYESYKPDPKVLKKISRKLKGLTIISFVGTWCKDSRQEIPRFYKIMENAGFDFEKNFTLVGVNRSFTIPKELEKQYKVKKVPTFVFYKNGKELGQIVEIVKQTLEKDILKIVSKRKHKHSYLKNDS